MRESIRNSKVSPNPSKLNVLDPGALSKENREIFTASPENKNDGETQHHLSKPPTYNSALGTFS